MNWRPGLGKFNTSPYKVPFVHIRHYRKGRIAQYVHLTLGTMNHALGRHVQLSIALRSGSNATASITVLFHGFPTRFL